MKTILSVLLWLAVCAAAGRAQDADDAFGWAVCSAENSFDDVVVTGALGGRLSVIKSNGGDMKDLVKNAILSNDIVVLDGSAGDFVFSRAIDINGISDKTIVGVNNACIRTEFTVTEEIRDYLDALGINSLSSTPGQGLGGTLPNGQTVDEQLEYNLRLSLIEKFGDLTEPYRYAGGITMKNARNVIIRNISFTGPGSLDVGGYDLLTFIGCRNCWVDHCSFTDGIDGNFDIRSSDFITVSWCRFDYTDKSYNHRLSNLTAVDGPDDPGRLNLTWAFCHWADGCQGRMPLVAVGLQHIYNCYYTPKTGYGITGGSGVKVLAENNYFGKKVDRVIKPSGMTAVTCRGNIAESGNVPSNTGAAVEVGYAYSLIDAAEVPAVVGNPDTGAGATLVNPLGDEVLTFHHNLDYSAAAHSCDVKVTWTFDKGIDNPRAGSVDKDAIFDYTLCSLGANVTVHSCRGVKNCDMPMTLLQPVVDIPKAGNPDSYIRFTLTQQENVVFVPGKLRFNSTRVGTDMGFFDVVARMDGYEYCIATQQKPVRESNAPYFSSYEGEFPGEYAASDTEVTIQLYDFSSKKQWAFNGFEIIGKAYFFNSGITDVSVDAGICPVYYTLQGIRVANPRSGEVYIVVEGGASRKIFLQ